MIETPVGPMPAYPVPNPREGAFGFGFQAGVHVEAASGVNFGLSFKSPQWFNDFEFTVSDDFAFASAFPDPFTFRLDYPMILSVGIAYVGSDRLVLAADARYIDFANAKGFDTVGYDVTGAVVGFGWKSIVVLAAGLEYELTSRLPVRLGYSYNSNPIENEVGFFNTPSPAIIQNRASGGLSYVLSETFSASVVVQYGFDNQIEGPWQQPGGANSMTSVRSDLATITFIGGVSIGL
jgi:long-chain fatty acid transport protein